MPHSPEAGEKCEIRRKATPHDSSLTIRSIRDSQARALTPRDVNERCTCQMPSQRVLDFAEQN